jgi:hypothetical protein
VFRFFRTLRQRFLSDRSPNRGHGPGRVSRYLLYAIGEILLVVIGILIALQVNNWNEDRQQRQVELKYFRNLRNDLQADVERLDYMIGVANNKVHAAQNIAANAARDSIGSLYGFSNDMLALVMVDEFRPNDNTYEEMKSSGNFSTIRNDTLKLKLMNLKKSYIDIGTFQEHVRYDFNVFLEDFEKYVDWGKYFNLKKSDIPRLDFAYDSVYIERHRDAMEAEVGELYRNKVFLNNIFLLEINYTYDVEVLQNTRAQVVEIIGILARELDSE